MGRLVKSEPFPATVLVDGATHLCQPLRWVWHNAIGVMVTADSAAVGRLLPSGLQPLRVLPHRAALSVGGAQYDWYCGALPLFRSYDVSVFAAVTSGSKPAPPVVPMLGLALNGRVPPPFGAGFYPLLVATTNRVAKELYRTVLGWPALLADARCEVLPGHMRATCSEDGRLILEVTARTPATVATFTEGQPWYGVRDGVLFRAAMSGEGLGGDVSGSHAGTVAIGEHPASQPLHSLHLQARARSCNVCVRFDQTILGPVRALGPAQTAGPAESPTAPVETARARGGASPARDVLRRAVLARPHAQDRSLDQGIDRLPFDPAAELRAQPMRAANEVVTAAP